MYQLTILKWLVLGVASFFVGVAKSGVPGLGSLIAPLFAEALPPRASTGVVLPLLIVGDITAVLVYRRTAVWRHVIRLFPWAALGIVAGYFLMGRLDDRFFGPIIGSITLTMLVIHLWRDRRYKGAPPIPDHLWFAVSLGFLAGFTTMLANAAGPIMVLYLLAMRLPKLEFIGTGAWYFFLLNLFKIPFSRSLGLINPTSLLLNLKLAPLVIAGSLLGAGIASRLQEKTFNRILQVLAAVAAVNLFFR